MTTTIPKMMMMMMMPTMTRRLTMTMPMISKWRTILMENEKQIPMRVLRMMMRMRKMVVSTNLTRHTLSHTHSHTYHKQLEVSLIENAIFFFGIVKWKQKTDSADPTRTRTRKNTGPECSSDQQDKIESMFMSTSLTYPLIMLSFIRLHMHNRALTVQCLSL